jgi:hypothetical protein
MARCHKSGCIPSSQSADDSGSSNGGVANGDDILEFCFEDTVAPLSVHIFRSVCSPWSHNMLPHYIEPGTAIELCAPVKVLACADCDNRIRICECGEDTDFVGVFELSANSHDCWIDVGIFL